MTTAEQAAKHLLSEEEKKHYEEEGYIIVRNVISPETVELLKNRSRAIVLGDHPPDQRRRLVKDIEVAKGRLKVDDPEKGMWKLMDPDLFDSIFEDYLHTPKLLDVCEGLIGEDLKAFLLMMIYKPPNLAKAVHHYHQDSLYFPFGPHDLVLGTWIALDATTADNGTLRVIPRSHKGEIEKHVLPEGEVNAGIFGVEGYDDHPDEVVVEMEPGDGLFFHSRLLHKSGGNATDGHRRVITVHMTSSKCTWTGEKPANYFKMRRVRGRDHEGCV